MGRYTCMEYLNLSVTELSSKLNQGEVSSEELVPMYIKQISRVNPLLNAMCYHCFDEAIELAKQCDQNRKKAPDKTFPFLYGIPFISKECYEIPNKPYTCGVLKRKNIKGVNTCTVIEQLQEQGAIVLCAG